MQIADYTSVLLDHFLSQAVEVDVDLICDGQQVVIGAIMQSTGCTFNAHRAEVAKAVSSVAVLGCGRAEGQESEEKRTWRAFGQGGVARSRGRGGLSSSR